MSPTLYRAFAALAVISGFSFIHADSLDHQSFTGSMFSSAFAKFHVARDSNRPVTHTVATSVQVVAVTKVQESIKADVLPKKADQIPIVPDVITKKQDAPTIKAEVVPTPALKPQGKTDVSAKKDTSGSIPVMVIPTDSKPAEVKPAAAQVTPPKIVSSDGTVSNLFVDAEIKSVFNDVATMAGVTIIADDTIKEQTISIEFKNEPVEAVVEKLALVAGGYAKELSKGVYLISKATADSTFFSKFAETKIYSVRNQTAATIQSLLSVAYKPYISVDPKTNSIGICAPKQLMEKIFADIEKADRPGRQIYVEALVTEVSVQDELNTSFSGSAGKIALGANLGITTATAGFADIAQIQALITNHKMKLRANPHLIATAGQESTINVGQDTYYSILSGSTIYPTTQIQLIHTGVVLKFTGTIGDDGLITMQLDPSVSDAITSVNGNPTSNIRTASTRIRVKSGETIVIAGLVQETGDKQVIRIPLLGYIPVIGEFFTQRNQTKRKVETVFLITPKILDNPSN